MKKIFTATAIVLSLSVATWGQAKEDHHAEEARHSVGHEMPGDAVKHEMRLLDAAYKNLLESILLDTPEAIEEPFHLVHRAKMATEKALHSGKVKLPKNGDKLGEFVELDEAFHDKLKKLLAAAGTKDRKGIKDSAHEILDACVQCHDKFRN